MPHPTPSPERRLLQALALLVAFTALMFIVRKLLVGRGMNFLIWNLFLAALPVATALAARRLATRTVAFIALLVGWLVFFPNAPYIVTDLMHIRTSPPRNLWLDILVLGSAAATGLAAGLVSLRAVHGALLDRGHRSRLAWVSVVIACMAAGFGVFLGRFQRWNSWDIVTRPAELLADAWASLDEANVLAFSLLFAVLVFAGYLVLAALLGPPAALPREASR
jgi:uncharacterized membrane protein